MLFEDRKKWQGGDARRRIVGDSPKQCLEMADSRGTATVWACKQVCVVGEFAPQLSVLLPKEHFEVKPCRTGFGSQLPEFQIFRILATGKGVFWKTKLTCKSGLRRMSRKG